MQDSFNNVEEKDEFLEYYYDISTDDLKLHEEPGHIKTQICHFAKYSRKNRRFEIT